MMFVQRRLRYYMKYVPHFFSAVDHMRTKYPTETCPRWPRYCYAPMELIAMTLGAGGVAPEATSELIPWISWRPTQGIYRFCPDLAAEIISTEATMSLSPDIYTHLPEWCVYIESPPQIPDCISGAFVWGDAKWSGDRWTDGMGVAEVHPDEGMTLAMLELERETLAECRSRKLMGAAGDEIASRLPIWISLAAYLCTYQPELVARGNPGAPLPARIHRGNKAERLPPRAPTIWHVGFDLGRRLRESSEYQGGTHAGPRAHVRRAHWHTYRVGKGRLDTRLLWLHPILVAGMPDRPTLRTVPNPHTPEGR